MLKNLEQQVPSLVATFHIRKAMTGTFRPQEAADPFRHLIWVVVLVVIAAISIGHPIGWWIALFVFGAVFLQLLVSQYQITYGRRSQLLRSWIQSPEIRDETYERLQRQTRELLDQLPSFNSDEQTLLVFLTSLMGNASWEKRELTRLLALAMNMPNLSQNEFIQEVAADFEIRPERGVRNV